MWKWKLCFPGGSASKESPCSVRDLGSIPGLGFGEGIGYPLQYAGLENSMDSVVGHDWATLTFTVGPWSIKYILAIYLKHED